MPRPKKKEMITSAPVAGSQPWMHKRCFRKCGEDCPVHELSETYVFTASFTTEPPNPEERITDLEKIVSTLTIRQLVLALGMMIEAIILAIIVI